MRKFLNLLISIVLLLAITAGCESAPELPVDLAVDWSMTAFVVKEDGTVADTFAMTINGTIRKEETESYLNLDINVPKEFRFWFKTAEAGSDLCLNSRAQQPGDFILGSYTYDRIENAPAMSDWAVNTEKEYFIAYWGKAFGRYLVAATDPDAAPEDIMKHFENFSASFLYE